MYCVPAVANTNNVGKSNFGHFGHYHFGPDWTLRPFWKIHFDPSLRHSLLKDTSAPSKRHFGPFKIFSKRGQRSRNGRGRRVQSPINPCWMGIFYSMQIYIYIFNVSGFLFGSYGPVHYDICCQNRGRFDNGHFDQGQCDLDSLNGVLGSEGVSFDNTVCYSLRHIQDRI